MSAVIHLVDCYRKAQTDFAALPQEEQANHMSELSGDCMTEMLLYAYGYLDEFKLILCRSEGTRFAGMIDEMVEIEVKGTHDYQEVLRSSADRHRKSIRGWIIS